jgi:hypothetical protein
MANYSYHMGRALMYREMARQSRRDGKLGQAHARYVMGLSNIKRARIYCDKVAPLYAREQASINLIKKERKA